MSYFLRTAAYSATAVKRTSVEELRAVSHESWMTPITNPTPTTCIAISFEIPNKLHATGINNNDPPVTPEAPHAATVDNTLSTKAVKKST